MDVGFHIGPRINAAGRMDAPDNTLGILLTDCRRTAEELAHKLDDYNRERQGYESRMRQDALAMLETDFDAYRDPVIVLGVRNWHPGVVGIVASRLMRQYHKPTFIIWIGEDGIGKGSGRSIEGVSLVDAIHACADELIAGGGHGMAAGLSIAEKKIDSFRRKFSDYVLRVTTPDQRSPKLYLDAEITFEIVS